MTGHPPAVAICVDASLAVAILLPEPGSPSAQRLWRGWAEAATPRIVPPHFQAEVVTAIRRAVVQGRISLDDEDAALDTLAGDILPDLEPAPCTVHTWHRAVDLARRLRRANVYDTLYLAVAEEAGAEFWTTDANLVRALEADGHERPKWVRLVEP